MKTDLVGQIDRGSPVPLYEQVAEQLRERVFRGEYPRGSKIPNYKELSQMFGVSAITIRQAVAQLEQTGLLTPRQGKGTFVVDGLVVQERLLTLQSVSEVLQSKGLVPRVEVITFELTRPDRRTAEELQLAEDEKILRISRRHVLTDLPIAYAVIHVPEKIGLQMTKEQVERWPVYHILESHLRIQIHRASQRVRAVTASHQLAQMLDIRKGSPILHAHRITYSVPGDPLELIDIYYRADKYEFQFEMTRDWDRGVSWTSATETGPNPIAASTPAVVTSGDRTPAVEVGVGRGY